MSTTPGFDLTANFEAAAQAIANRRYGDFPADEFDIVDAHEAIEAALPNMLEQIREGIAAALLGERITCPVHGIPDCSPLLNGCSLPAHLFRHRDANAEVARNFGVMK